MKKRKRALALACMLLCLAGISPRLARAAEEEALPDEQGKPAARVIDDAGVLMEEEIDWIEEVASDVSETSGWAVVAASCADAGGKSSREACESYLAAYAAGSDGICCLVDTDNGSMEIAATGAAESCLSGFRIRKILKEAGEGFEKEDYAQCFFVMLLGANEAFLKGEQNPLVAAGAGLSAALLVLAGAYYFHHATKLENKKKENDTEEQGG